jgi:pyruvate/2-oxoglutarate/acetoin dehydrogenase E1 component
VRSTVPAPSEDRRSPLDRETVLAWVAKTSRVIVLHEAPRTGGIGAELAAAIAEEGFEYLDGPVVRVASLDTPVQYSPPLEAAYMPTVDKVAAARRLLEY